MRSSSAPTARRARRLTGLLASRRCAFFRRRPGRSLEKIDVRRITLTPDEVQAGHQSWLRVDPETGRLESVLYFARPPSYAAALPTDLAHDLSAWIEAAHAALIPYLEADVKKASTNPRSITWPEQ